METVFSVYLAAFQSDRAVIFVCLQPTSGIKTASFWVWLTKFLLGCQAVAGTTVMPCYIAIGQLRACKRRWGLTIFFFCRLLYFHHFLCNRTVTFKLRPKLFSIVYTDLLRRDYKDGDAEFLARFGVVVTTGFSLHLWGANWWFRSEGTEPTRSPWFTSRVLLLLCATPILSSLLIKAYNGAKIGYQ